MTLSELYSRKRWWSREGDGNGWVYMIGAGIRGYKDETALYIGKTVKSPRGRLTNHISNCDLLGLAIQRKIKAARNWAIYILTIDECLEIQANSPRRERKHPITDLESAELFMIHHYKPLFNFAAQRRNHIRIPKDYRSIFAEYSPEIWGENGNE